MASPGGGVELATAYVNLVASAKGLGDDATKLGGAAGGKAGGAFSSKFGGSVKGVAGTLGGLFAAGAVGAYVKDSLGALARIDTLNAQTAQVIASTGAKAGVSAEHIATLTGNLESMTATEQETIQSGANMLLTFTNVKNGVGKSNQIFDDAVGIMTDMSRAMGTDTKGAAIQLGKALNDPVKGVSALSKVGVSFTQEQKDQIATLVKSGKTMEAQKIILRELNTEFGGQGKAYAATAAGQWDLFTNAIGDFGEAALTRTMPALTKLAGKGTAAVSWINNWVLATHDLPPSVKTAETAVTAWAVSMGTKLAPVLQQTGAVLGPAFKQVFATLAPIFQQLFPIIMQIVQAFSPFSLIFHALLPILPQVAAVFGQIANVIAGGLASAFAAVQPILALVVGLIDEMMPFITELIASLLPPLIDLFDQVAPLLDAIFAAIVPVVSQLAKYLIPIIKDLMPVVKIVFEYIANTIRNVMNIVKGIIDTVTGLISGNWSKVWNGIKAVLSAVWDQIKNVVSTVTNAVARVLSVAWDNIKKVAAAAWGLVKEYIVGPLTAAWDWVKGVFGAVGSGIGGFLNGIWENIKKGAKAAWDLVKKYIVDPLQAAWNWVTGTFGKIGQWFADLWQGIADTATSIWSGIKVAISSAFEGIVDVIKTPINGLIWFINHTIIWGINKLIDGANFLIRFIPGVPYIDHLADIPSLAAGGVVEPIVGGRIVRVAEAGQREIVTPEPLMRSVVRDALAAAPGPSAGPLIGSVQVTHPIDEWQLARNLDRLIAFRGGPNA